MEYTTYEKIYTYNPDKTIKSIFDSKLNDVKTYEYDEQKRIIKEYLGNDQIRETVYSENGYIERLLIKNGNGDILAEATTSYNEAGLPVTEKMMNGVIFNNTYDSFNRILTKTNTLGDTYSYEYNDIGRNVTKMENGNLTKETQKKFTNRAGEEIYRSLIEEFINGVVHTMEYNEYGELVKFKNNSNFEYIIEYNSAGNETLYQSKFATIAYVYDENNNILSQTNNGELLYEYTYQDNRLVTRCNVMTDETETYVYNTDGLIEKIVFKEQYFDDPYMM